MDASRSRENMKVSGSDPQPGGTRVLFIGQDPDTVDFSDPALPPGTNAEKIHAGIGIAMNQMAERGWRADLCLVTPDQSASGMVETQLKTVGYDCIVIGGGIRVPPKSLALFESLLNAVHEFAPRSRIAFNTRPEDTAEAASRWIAV